MPVSSSRGSDLGRISPGQASGAAILSGVLFLLSFPPFGLATLAWCALVPLLLIRHRVDRRMLLFDGYLVAAVPVSGIAYNIAVFHVGAFAVVALAVPAAFALAITAADELEKRVASPSARLLVFPSCAVAIEYVLRVVFHAPVTIALSQASHPLVIQCSDLFGASAATFLLILGNCCLERLGLWLAARRQAHAAPVQHLIPVLGGAAVLAGNLVYGSVALRAYGHVVPTLRIAAVQPAIDSETYRERWFNPEAQRSIDSRVGSLIDDALATQPDLVFISEGSDGRYSFRVPALRKRIHGLAGRTRSGLLIASPDMTPEGEELNAVFSVAPDGAVLGRYTKQIFTPVGEEHLSRGSAREPLATHVAAIGAMVCFESCFPEVARELVQKGAEILLVTTSDAPFRNGSMPLLHAAFSVFRAIETRRYVVQAANTGPSLVVDPTGMLSARSSFLQATVLFGAVQPLAGRTVYAAIGDVLPMVLTVWLLSVATVALLGARRKPRQAERRARRHEPDPDMTLLVRTRFSFLGAALAMIVVIAVCSLGTVGSITLSTATSGVPVGVAASVQRFFRGPNLDTASQIRRFLQTDNNTCGAAALAFALRFYDVDTSEGEIAGLIRLEDRGTNLLELARATDHFGMEAVGVRMNMAALVRRSQPTLVHVGGNHFVVVIEVANGRVLLFDPAHGLVRLSAASFERAWDGSALVLRFPPSQELDGAPRLALNRAGHTAPEVAR